MKLRQANIEDAKQISTLITGLSHFFTVQPDGKGAETFLKSLSEEAIKSYILNSEYVYIVLVEDDVIAGVAALRDGQHVFHLFVHVDYQRQGLSSILWEAIQKKIKPGTSEITVNSTPYAVPVYEKFGFSQIGSQVEKNGVVYVPMKRRVVNKASIGAS